MPTSSSAAPRVPHRSSRRMRRRRRCVLGAIARFSWSIWRCRATSSPLSRNSRIFICFRSTIYSNWSTKTVNSGNLPPATRGFSSRRRSPASWPNHERMTRGPAIRALRQHADTIRLQTVEQARRMLAAGKSTEEVIEYLGHTLTNRLLHNPTQALRQASESADASLADTLVRLLVEERGRQ